MSNEIERFNNLLDEMKELHQEKNDLYGSSFERLIDQKGLVAGYIPLANKLHRINTIIEQFERRENLTTEKRIELQEALKDSLADLGNYAFKFLSKYREDTETIKADTIDTGYITGTTIQSMYKNEDEGKYAHIPANDVNVNDKQ